MPDLEKLARLIESPTVPDKIFAHVLTARVMEQLDYNLLFRWFVGLSADDPVWDATVFCKNRDACSMAISRPSSLPAC